MTGRACVAAAALATALSPRPSFAQADDGNVMVNVPPDDSYSDTDPSALTDFRPALDPYGSWVDDPTYGTAWTPAPAEVGADFEPYASAGRWDYAGNDYTWVSDYAWGAICFHYGRWANARGRWLWIPGRQYAGAWVDWRMGDESTAYLGWAPMAPTWIWMGGSSFGVSFAGPERWAFAPFGEVFSVGLRNHVTLVGAREVSSPFWSHTRPYVRAQPVTVGTAFAQGPSRGPLPSTMGVDIAHINHAVPTAGELRARQMARPSSAVALGARAPTPHVVVRAGPRGPMVPRAMPAAGHNAAPSHNRR